MINIESTKEFIDFCDSMIIDIGDHDSIVFETPLNNIVIADNSFNDIVKQVRELQVTEKDISEHVWKYHKEDLPERQTIPGTNSWFIDHVSSKQDLSQYITILIHKCDTEIAKMLKQKKTNIVCDAKDTHVIGKLRHKPLSENPTIYDCKTVRLVFSAIYKGNKAKIRFINAYPVR